MGTNVEFEVVGAVAALIENPFCAVTVALATARFRIGKTLTGVAEPGTMEATGALRSV